MADKNWQEIADECEVLAAIVNLAPMHAAARAVREQADEIERLRAFVDVVREFVEDDGDGEDLFSSIDHKYQAVLNALAQIAKEARRG